MLLPPVACSLRVAAYPLKGASPVAWQSQFHGDCWNFPGVALEGV